MEIEQIQARTPAGVVNNTGLYALTTRDRVTVVAALRLLHDTPGLTVRVGPIMAHGKEGIDALCDSILHPGLEFEEIAPLFGYDETNRYVASARNLARQEELRVDVPALVCEAEEGAYVMAWLWVSREDAGLGSAD